MSLQEEELVSSHAGQPEQASSLLDQIMAQTRIQPGSEGYDVARQGVTAFIASILQSTASAEPVNKLVVDSMIADIDERISRQMDVIIHAPAFQQVESFWRSLKTMVDRVDFRENIKVNVLHVTKQELLEDFEFAPEIIQSGFYKHVYSSGFGQFGGEPIAAVLGAYEFKNTAPDMKLLQYVSAVGAMAHAPFLSSVSPEFMGLNSWTELPNIKDLYAIFEGPAYTKWRALRDSEDSRYLGLTAPRFLLRQPYSPTDNPVKNFNYYEDVSQNHEDYLWGNTAWMLACNIADSFAKYRWCPNIIGPQSGGAVKDLPVHLFETMGQIQLFRTRQEWPGLDRNGCRRGRCTACFRQFPGSEHATVGDKRVTAKAPPDISAISALTAVKHGNCSSLTPLLNPVRTRKSLIWP
ncbi:type VI secretion protein EvpB [Escherichia coli]|nr:type VI secretion protein EvpB [Escherichia coli]